MSRKARVWAWRRRQRALLSRGAAHRDRLDRRIYPARRFVRWDGPTARASHAVEVVSLEFRFTRRGDPRQRSGRREKQRHESQCLRIHRHEVCPEYSEDRGQRTKIRGQPPFALGLPTSGLVRNRFYYSLKPYLPWRLRLALRRVHARLVLGRSGDVWPIRESAGRRPADWIGWPDGKQFAFVLTHDVESQAGLDRVKDLARLEVELGFRSCFYFIPEGPYRVGDDLRHWLIDRGFEVGVHDLHHDGKLYRSRQEFSSKAQRINGYLRKWNAVGFRAGFMHHNLGWHHDLDITYDASTFDTDPFEPQPDGVGTIFPFRVPAPTLVAPKRSEGGPEFRRPTSDLRSPISDHHGYVELPYTLPQDFTLFTIFRQQNISIWKRKLDWIAACGGMALLNVHPDYMEFSEDRRPAAGTYSARWYREFLEHVHQRYSRGLWRTLPGSIACMFRHPIAPGLGLSLNPGDRLADSNFFI